MFAATKTTTIHLEQKNSAAQESKVTKELTSQFEKMKKDLNAYLFSCVGTFRIDSHVHLMPCKSLDEFKTAMSKNIFPITHPLDDDNTLSPMAAGVLKLFSDEPLEEKERDSILNMARNRRNLLNTFSLMKRDLNETQEKELEFLQTALIYLMKLAEKKVEDEKNNVKKNTEKAALS
jgi:hypothetical protein